MQKKTKAESVPHSLGLLEGMKEIIDARGKAGKGAELLLDIKETNDGIRNTCGGVSRWGKK